MFRLTSDNIFDLPIYFRHFKIGLQIMKNWEIRVSGQFFHRSVNRKNLQKIFLSSLICPLQMTNWQWTPIIDPSCRKRTLYLLPIKKNPIRWLIFLRTVDQKIYQKIFFSSLICPLKMSNGIEALSLTFQSVNGHFIEWPPQYSKRLNPP